MTTDEAGLEPQLRERWRWMRAEWDRRYPDAPKPFLTCVYRDEVEQAKAYREGKSRAKPGQSLHGYQPAYAFDVAMKLPDGGVTWDWRWFELWGALAKSVGLTWGGDWAGLRDGPHVQLPMTYQDAMAGRVPTLPPLPKLEPALTTLVLNNLTPEDLMSLARDVLEGRAPVLRKEGIKITTRAPKVDVDLSPRE